ncbi:DNA replication factor Cdt1 isoform X2 [Scyliorhinus canicula]|uniref:DNA replication factor Cdt1 isoform X2 n=1 Tax=Scyliorhinus canicula TaxID=7830 RepID=UPI0018F7B6D9|nr:DNA replication factor Cdt1 isoform X2 [Scyliorhinus canicula]
MAQPRLTDFFPQTKHVARGPRSLKRQKVEAPGGGVIAARLSPRKGSDRPAGSRESPTPSPEGGGERLSRPNDLATPPQGAFGGAGLRPGSRRPALGSPPGSSGRKRGRPQSPDAGEPRAGSQRADRVPSARRCLLLQPEAAETPPAEKTKVKPQTPLQITGGSEPTTDSTPAKETLLGLKARLQRIQKLTPTPNSFAPTSELNSDIKSRLKRVRELELKVQENKLQQRKATEQEVKSSAEERAKAPAYQRFHNLAQDIPPGLNLPFKYKLLAEMFRNMDTIVSMLFNRSETITFTKVKQGVQDLMRKKFEERNVGQIKTVYPSAYKFRQEKGIPTWSDSVKRSSYQLTVDPVFEGEENSDGHTQLTASHLLLRRRIFSRNLVSIVKQYHKIFLASLDPPIHVPDNKLTRWHPRFNVDEIPDVTAAELPQPPDFEKLTTAREVLDKARSMMTPKMEKALANMALKTAETAMAASTEQKTESNVVSPSPGALKGISQSLLERIRAKEAQKMKATITRTAAQTERLHMMMRLPEIIRILRNVFVAEKKPALTITVACNRVVDSYRSGMVLDEMEKHLRLLADIVPDWLTVHQIRKDVYLKLNRSTELNVVAEKIAEKIKEEEKV